MNGRQRVSDFDQEHCAVFLRIGHFSDHLPVIEVCCLVRYFPVAVGQGHENIGALEQDVFGLIGGWMDKILAGFKIEYWYHVFIVVGAAGAIASLVFDFKGVANPHAFLVFCGLFFWGIGEWISHPLQTGIMRRNIYAPVEGVVSGHPRKLKILGLFFDGVGLALLATGIYKIANAV